MRTKKTLINSAYSLGAYLILFLIGLVTRKLFVANFDSNLLGYSSLIETIFNLLAVTEMGVGSVISYRLYQHIGEKATDEISRFMSLYQMAYRVIGMVIGAAAVVLAFCLPFIITEPGTDWPKVYTIYLLQTVSTLSTYFMAFRRLLYTADQRGYVCTRIDLVCNVIVKLGRAVIAASGVYWALYFALPVACNIAANLLISRRYPKDFPEVHPVKVTWGDFKALGVFHDVGNYLVHRVSNAIYGGIDNIVITRILGIGMVTVMGFYTTIQIMVNDMLNRILDAFAAGIGNLVYDKDAVHGRSVFWGLDLASYFLGSFACIAYLCLFQPFITLWMGENYLLPMGFVVAFALNEYVGWNHRMLGNYRAVLGRFEEDRWFMVASAVVNLILSVALVFRFGISGVVMATVVAHCCMWVGRAMVVCRHYMTGCLGAYWRKQALRALLLAANAGLTCWLCSLTGSGFLAFVAKGVIVCLVPNILNAAVLLPTHDAEYLRGKAADLLAKLPLKRKGA